MFRKQKTAAARDSLGEAPSPEHPLILSIQAYYVPGLAGDFRPSSWNLMSPDRPSLGSSSAAISARPRHIIKRLKRSQHSRLQAPQMGPNAPGPRSRGRQLIRAEPHHLPRWRRGIKPTREGKGRSAHRALIGSRSPCAAWHPHPPPPGGQQNLMTDGLNTIDGLHRRHPAKHSSPPRHPSTRSIGTRSLIQAWQT